MSRQCLALALWMLLATGALAQEPALARHNQASERYRQGQYQQAREQYLEVVEAGVRDPQVYYNLGNACFKAGRLGEAVLWYERARRLAPRDPDIRANLRLADELLLGQAGVPEGAGQWLEDLYLFPTLDELSAVFGLCFLAAWGLGGWRLWRRAWGAWWRPALFAAACALAASSGLYLGARLYGQSQAQAVVLEAEVAARSAPDPQQTPVFVAREGARLFLGRREGAWVLVRLPSGLGGWVPEEAVEQI